MFTVHVDDKLITAIMWLFYVYMQQKERRKLKQLFICYRSMRGSRPGSLKLGQQSTVKENGDITHLMMGGGGNFAGGGIGIHRTDDFDLKMLQQRKQQAEIKR